MAWLDERIWCHPKFTDLSAAAGWTYVKGLAYSSGFQTRGRLSAGQQRTIGSDARTRRELVSARLWEPLQDGAVAIHDWGDHNDVLDAKRAADRERKRRQRARDNGRNSGVTTVTETVTET